MQLSSAEPMANKVFHKNKAILPPWHFRNSWPHFTFTAANQTSRIGLIHFCWLREATVFCSVIVEIRSRAETWLAIYLPSLQAGLVFTALRVWEVNFYNSWVVKDLSLAWKNTLTSEWPNGACCLDEKSIMKTARLCCTYDKRAYYLKHIKEGRF